MIAASGVTVFKDQDVCSLINCNSKTAITPQTNLKEAELKDLLSQKTKEQSNITKELPNIVVKQDVSKSKIQESNFFSFELKSCRTSGTTVVCDFTITNLDDTDRKLFAKSVEMFDDSHNKSAGKGEIGANGIFLVSGTPKIHRLQFTNVSPSAERISLITFKLATGTSYYNSDSFEIKFRDIALKK